MDEEQKIMRACYEAVLEGRKPSSMFSLKWDVSGEDIGEARGKGFEVVLTGAALRENTHQPKDAVVIARPEKFTSLLSERDLQRFRNLGFGERLDELLGEIGAKSIAETLAYLNAYPRVDDEYDIAAHNWERPEVAILTGIALGYPTCDVEYYVRIVYLGDMRNPQEGTHSLFGYALCPECSLPV